MNPLTTVMSQEWVYRLGWALLHSLWQGALVALLFGAARFALRRQSARVRYGAACLALALLAAGPVATLWGGPGWQVPPGRGRGGPAGVSAAAPGGAPARAALVREPGVSLGFVAGPADWPDKMLPAIVLLWAAGVGGFLFRGLHGGWQVRRLRTRAVEPVGPVWLATLNDLRRRLGLSRPVRLLQSALVEVPTVVGWLTPVILVPASTLVGLSPAQVEAVLAHELAHVVRGDYLVNALQNVAETLLFYHPAVWWISRCIREEREHCCDDVVLRVCGDRVGYARALATLEELRAEIPPLAFAAAGGSLLARIRRLVGAPAASRPAGLREYAGLTLMGAGLVLVIAGASLMMGPRTYRAAARVRVEHDLSVQLSSDRGNATLNIQDPYFLQTEMALAASDTTLSRVVEREKLDEAWAQPGGPPLPTSECVTLLRRRLALRPVPSTLFFEIQAFSPSPAEAARIANDVAECYRDGGFDQELSSRDIERDSLQRRLEEQQQKIAAAQDEVDALRLKLKVPAGVADETTMPFTLTAENLRRMESLRVESQADCARQETLLRMLKRMRRDELIQALPTTTQDPLLSALCSQLDSADLKLAALKRQYGPDHPEVAVAAEQVKGLRAKVDTRVSGILAGLEAKLASSKEGLASLAKEVQQAAEHDTQMATEFRPYFEARKRLEELQRFAQVLQAKAAADTVEARQPRRNRVAIVDRATETSRPVSPNRPRAAALILLGCLAGIVGIRLVRIG